MPNRHGDFIWYELMTDDADAAQDFYGKVVGWSFEDSGQEGMDYRIFSGNKGAVGGILPISEDMKANGARPFWVGYVTVDDVDEGAKAIKDLGGAIHMDQEVPGVGRMAFAADPQGAMFYVMKPTPPADDPDATSLAFAATEPMIGHCAWNELATDDPVAAKSFYGALFGWEQDGDMDMGELGKYEFWKVGDDRGFMFGAVMPKMPEMPVSMWTYYFRVPDIDTAVETIKANGGQILQEPIEIPGGDFSMNGMDLQGAPFALVGPRK